MPESNTLITPGADHPFSLKACFLKCFRRVLSGTRKNAIIEPRRRKPFSPFYGSVVAILRAKRGPRFALNPLVRAG